MYFAAVLVCVFLTSACCGDDKTTSTTTLAPTTTASISPSTIKTTSTCFDEQLSCPETKKFCLDPHFTKMMHQKCRKTCNFCSDNNTTCHDNSRSCWTYLQNGFCKSKWYTTEQKKKSCQSTCGLC
ncbi:hypothetical protein L596_022957 [Steinernema carpocapsae]|uniref:ShKT domain-containing protein n=1 Tax=Steinernema carpocapsae TaxID=34508 RepID=A0A4U5MC50_STECR|nr:hypothetical protein L596_022957 [Steinernema carpocapsae]